MEFIIRKAGKAMDEMKKYPGWKHACDVILARINSEGYGIMISHEELLKMLDIKPPMSALTAEEWRNHQFEVLSNVENLKHELLMEYSVYLMNVRGEGYQVLHPNDQVEKAPDKHFKKARDQIQTATSALTNVNIELLDIEKNQLRLKRLERMAFIQAMMSKRKTVAPDSSKPKKLPEGEKKSED